MLGESVSVGGDALFIVLMAALALLVTSVAVAVTGCVLAYKAGGGSRGALSGWIAIAVVEGGAMFISTGSVFRAGRRITPLLSIITAVLLIQVALFFVARAGRR